MSAPRPHAFRMTCDQAREMLTHKPGICGQTDSRTGQPMPMCVPCWFEWSYNAGYDRSSTDETKVASVASSPTENVVFSKRALRDACKRASHTVKALTALEGLLAHALEGSDPKHHVGERWYASGSRMVLEEDLAEAREAKRKRESRGEGFGEG